MQAYFCSGCSRIFYQDELRIIHEKDEPDGTVCPCGSDDYEEFNEEYEE